MVIIIMAGCGRDSAKKGDSGKPAIISSGEASDGAGSTAGTAKETAAQVLRLTQDRKWTAVYDYVYTDTGETLSRDEFIKIREVESTKSKLVYKKYELGEPKMLDEWTDGLSGKSYQNVAEVPYTVDVITPNGKFKVNNSLHLIQTPENEWRYIWNAKK